MMENIFGRWFAYVIDFAIAFIFIGFLICYISVFADYIQMFILQVGGDDKKPFNVIYLKLIEIPICLVMCMMKSPKILSQISAFALLFIVVTVITLVVFFIIFAARGKVDIVVNDKSLTLPFPNALDTAWPANIHTGYVILELIQRIPMFMPLYSAQPTLPVLLHDI